MKVCIALSSYRHQVETNWNVDCIELKKEADTEHLREIQRQQAALQAEEEMERLKRKLEEEQRRQAERDARAQAKMEKVQTLVTGWGQQAQAEADKKANKKRKGVSEFTDGDEQIPQVDESAIFGEDSSDEDENNEPDYNPEREKVQHESDIEGEPAPKPTTEDLFGDSSSDEELLPTDDQHVSSNKRIMDSDDEEDNAQDESSNKKRKIVDADADQ